MRTGVVVVDPDAAAAGLQFRSFLFHRSLQLPESIDVAVAVHGLPCLQEVHQDDPVTVPKDRHHDLSSTCSDLEVSGDG